MSETAPFDEPDYPSPPRVWWLKRLTIVVLLWFLAIAGLIVWWNREADRRLVEGLSQILSDSPTTAPAIVLPDEFNARVTLMAATRVLPVIKDGNLLQSHKPVARPVGIAQTIQDQLGSQSGPSRTLARLARFQAIDEPPTVPVATLPITAIRDLANVVSATALYEHARGNDAEAIELARDMLSITRRFQHDRGGVFDAFSGIFVERTALTIWAVADEMNVNVAAGATTQPTGPANTVQVKSLIGELLDDGNGNQQLARAMRRQRIDLAGRLTDPKVRTQMLSQIILAGVPEAPLDLDIVRFLARMEQTAAHLAANRPGDAEAAWALSASQDRTVITRVSQPISSQASESFRLQFKTNRQKLTELHAVATALAVRLYEIERGNLPNQLEELVPDYLPAIPVDPFSRDQKAFRYLKAPSLMIYSVGENGTDDGGIGSAAWTPGKMPAGVNPLSHPGRWQSLDAVFLLRVPGPATQPAVTPGN